MVNYEQRHFQYLTNLIKNFDKVDENINDMKFVFKEGSLYRKGNKNQYKLCDLLIGFYDNSSLALELKGSWDKRDRALKQVHNGALLLDSFGYTPIRKKIVIYGADGYEYEDIHDNDRIINYY